MYQPNDIFKQEITAGDFIVYSVKRSTSVKTRLARVVEVIDNGTDTYEGSRYELKVQAFEYQRWTYESGKSEYKDRMYRTTLTSNATIVKLNNFRLPEGFVTLLKGASVV